VALALGAVCLITQSRQQACESTPLTKTPTKPPTALATPPPKAWDAPGTALIINERLINSPPALAPPLTQALFDEIGWAVEDEPTQVKRRLAQGSLLADACSLLLLLLLVFQSSSHHSNPTHSTQSSIQSNPIQPRS
jgi:hypothetical protein